VCLLLQIRVASSLEKEDPSSALSSREEAAELTVTRNTKWHTLFLEAIVDSVKDQGIKIEHTWLRLLRRVKGNKGSFDQQQQQHQKQKQKQQNSATSRRGKERRSITTSSLFDDENHPAHQLLSRFTGGKHKGRMARSCQRLTEHEVHEENSRKTTEEKCNNDEYNIDMALELRNIKGDAVSEVTRLNSYRTSIIDQIETQAHPTPFIGMILQVYALEKETPGMEENGLDMNRESFDFEKLGYRYGYDLVDSFTGSPCTLRGDSGECVQYELVEPLHMELGLAHLHSLDFAYRPIVVTSHPSSDRTATTDDRHESPQDSPHNSPHRGFALHTQLTLDYPGHQTMEENQDGVSRRWLPFVTEHEKGQTGHYNEEAYERMGDRAFAGGSHGEIWRARRNCSGLTFTKARELCDDQQDLIMKRLKIEHGYPVLEAGLREAYFGELFSRDVEAANLFTKYVDHFFRELPTHSLRGSSTGDVELWIVFENAGSSLRSFLYTPVTSDGFLIYQHSEFWRRLRMEVRANSKVATAALVSTQSVRAPALDPLATPTSGAKSASDWGHQQKPSNSTDAGGRFLMKEVLRQILVAAKYLHERGIVHRDIKPSNIMCQIAGDAFSMTEDADEISFVKCVLGDFSSSWNEFTSLNMYATGPSASEQTDEYAPPEVLFGQSWIPFHREKPQSYDSWSIGVVMLELLLGTPNVFSVDQRTTAILTSKMKKAGASSLEIEHALYLAALSQFCIYIPTATLGKSWPLRAGDPLHNAAMFKPTCTLEDFHSALRARDPLGIGFDSSSDPLLQLISELLAWDPMERITPSEALEHEYFKSVEHETSFEDSKPAGRKALQSLLLDPKTDTSSGENEISEFTCPKCGKIFGDLNSCQRHTTSRRHAHFCVYDHSSLPRCINAHAMLPAHPTSGYCDIQGRRQTIEDFHTIHLHPTHQFYGVFDGHLGNLASKFAASSFYNQLKGRFSTIDDDVLSNDESWKDIVEQKFNEAFEDSHDQFMQVVRVSPGGVHDQSGTTATILYVTAEAILVANIGDSRAVLSRGGSYSSNERPTAIQLTVDHVASNEQEQIQVKNRGGYIKMGGGIDRVNGILAVTRTIGDADLVAVLSRKPHVTALSRSEVREMCRNPDGNNLSFPCFVVLASDGLWDVMSNQEAVDMVVQVIRKFDSENGITWAEGGAFQEAAQMLTQEAFVRGSMDNIGVCVVAID